MAGRDCVVDGHVHCYPRFDARRFLRAAAGLAVAPSDHGGAGPHATCRSGNETDGTPVVVLALALTPAEGDLSAVRDRLVAGAGPEWECRAADGGSARFAESWSGREVVLLEGWQYRTVEGLEVLGLATSDRIPTGLEVREAMEAIAGAGGIAVLPWAFGKWWPRTRRRAIRELLEAGRDPSWFLGDTALRPGRAPPPHPFRLALRPGWPVLPGSDPLPLPGQDRKVGRYGFSLPGGLDRDRPRAGVAEALRGLRSSPQAIGRRDGIVDALAQQLRMRMGDTGS